MRERKSDLHTLREVALTNPFPGIRASYPRMQAASYFVELIEICTESDHDEPELFALLQRAFGYLNANEPTLRAFAHFETELARIAGVHDAKAIKQRSGVGAGESVWQAAALARTAFAGVASGAPSS